MTAAHRLATIPYVVGYSRLMGEDEAGTARPARMWCKMHETKAALAEAIDDRTTRPIFRPCSTACARRGQRTGKAHHRVRMLLQQRARVGGWGGWRGQMVAHRMSNAPMTAASPTTKATRKTISMGW